MQRTVSSDVSFTCDGPVRAILSVGVAESYATHPEVEVTESLDVQQDGRPIEYELVFDKHGTRMHVLDLGHGTASFSYRAEVRGEIAPPPVTELDRIRYLRPSRYCESDTLRPTALAEFDGLRGAELLTAVSTWVGAQLSYVSGSSRPTDGAVQTLLHRAGVCRDFAHLVIALMRALDVPARLVSVYAPGLSPMDFHAVAEVLVDDQWHIVDATGLAPRQSLVRIATGRDAADTAWLTTLGKDISLETMSVSATADTLPIDDGTGLVSLR